MRDICNYCGEDRRVRLLLNGKYICDECYTDAVDEAALGLIQKEYELDHKWN